MATGMSSGGTKSSLVSALGMSKPPNRLIESPERREQQLRSERKSLESGLEGYSRAIGQTQSEFERHILAKDDYERLLSIRQQLSDLASPPVSPVETIAPESESAAVEDLEKRAAWRKAASAFHPYRLIGERIQKADPDSVVAADIIRLQAEALRKVSDFQYDEAIAKLARGTELAKSAQEEINRQKAAIALETAADEEDQVAAFSMVVRVEDSEYGFDTDTDAKHFYLANTVGETGVLEKSETLRKMESVLAKCLERKERLEKAGASIDEIVQSVFKNVPPALWPDSVVKEVQLYKAVTAQIEAEKGLEEAENILKQGAEKAETVGLVISGGKALNEWAGEKFGEEHEKVAEFTETMKAFATGFAIATDLTGAAFSGVDALDKTSELHELEDNPVKEKIIEFERNKAIVACVNSLVGLGLNEGSELVPVLGAVVKGKDVLMEAAKAGYYFRNTLDLKVLTKGAKTDPRSAALLPLARLAREQNIAMSEAALNAVGSALEAAGKATELAHVAAPAGLALDVTGKIVRYGGKIIITGINMSDAKKAADLITQAAGPPPLRRAQIEVMKYASKYAKIAVVHLALKERDPWAIGHLENIGLERLDIDHPATSSKLIREYMALKAGGLLGAEQGEDQLEDGLMMKLAKGAGGGIASAAEWIRDKIVGRDTCIEYDPAWRAGVANLTLDAWAEVRTEAIAAGWYDSRPNLEEVLTTYGKAQTAHNLSYGDSLDKQIEFASELYAALEAVKVATCSIKAVANDQTTEHAGMKVFTQQWSKLADSRLDQVKQDRAKLIEAKAFPGLEGEVLEQAKQKFLDEAVETAKREQAVKAGERQAAIARLWDAHKIKTPWVTCTLNEFPNKIRSGLLTFGATGAMDFHESEVAELVVEVGELRSALLERLGRELLASPDDELGKNFTASAMSADRFVVEALRTACEQLYHDKMRREGATEASLWSPSSSDIVLDWEQWRRVIAAAKSGGWDQETNTGFTDSLKAYQEARRAFDSESQKTTPNPTVVEQQRGLVLGTLDELEKKLRAFRPVTKQKFHHPGLLAYRAGMLELCLAARVQCG